MLRNVVLVNATTFRGVEMVDAEDLAKGDAVRIAIRRGKTVMNGEVFARATFISLAARGVTFSYITPAGQLRRVTRSLGRIESIEKL